MKEWLTEWLAPFSPILFGLAAGSSAHFGRLIARGERPKGHEVLGFVMQLGLIGIVAALAVELSGIESKLLATFTTSVLALCVNEVVNWSRERAKATLRQLDPFADHGDERKGDK